MEYIGYMVTSVLAILMGQVVSHLNKKMPKVVAEEITYDEYYKNIFKEFKIDYKWSSIFLILFNSIMYVYGNSPMSYLYVLLISALSIAFYIDFKIQLIPDEVDVVIIALSIIRIALDFSNILNYLIGMVAGGGIFLAISLIALLIYKREGMGFGDVKLMAALGLFFGFKNILVITLVAFFFGAIIGGTLLIFKKKEKESYIAFGPFIVIASIMILFISPNTIIYWYITLCTSIGNFVTDTIFKLTGN